MKSTSARNPILPWGRRSHPDSGSSRCAPDPQWFSGRQGCQNVWCLCSLACSSSTAASQQTPADRQALHDGRDRVTHLQTRHSKAAAAAAAAKTNTDLPRGKTISRASGVALVSGMTVTNPCCKSGVKGKKELMIYEAEVQFQHSLQPCNWGPRAKPAAAVFARHDHADLQEEGGKSYTVDATFNKQSKFVDQHG